MKRFSFILVVFAWFFLVQGYGASFDSTAHSTVVGPFQSQDQCMKIAKEAEKEIRSTVAHVWPKFRTSSCWEVNLDIVNRSIR